MSRNLRTFFATQPAWSNRKKLQSCFVNIPDRKTIDPASWESQWQWRIQFWKDSIVAFCDYFSIFTITIEELEQTFKQDIIPPSLPYVVVCSAKFAFNSTHFFLEHTC